MHRVLEATEAADASRAGGWGRTTDGVFVEEGDELRFLRLGAPTEVEQRAIAWDACTKTIAHLRAQGRWLDLGEDSGTPDGEDPLALEQPLLASIYGASVVGRLVLGPRGGQRVMRYYRRKAA